MIKLEVSKVKDNNLNDLEIIGIFEFHEVPKAGEIMFLGDDFHAYQILSIAHFYNQNGKFKDTIVHVKNYEQFK